MNAVYSISIFFAAVAPLALIIPAYAAKMNVKATNPAELNRSTKLANDVDGVMTVKTEWP